MVGVGAAVYLGKAPRDLRFLAQLMDALRRCRLARGDAVELSSTVASISKPPAVESPTLPANPATPVTNRPASARPDVVASKPIQAAREVDETVEPVRGASSQDAGATPSAGTSQIGLEELIIDMAAQEVHLRQIVQTAADDQGGEFDWESLLSDVNEDVQKLLKYFNEARYLVEQEREVAVDSSQRCLDQLDSHWNAINQQSMQLLMISSEKPDPPAAARQKLAAICERVLTACRDTRQSCAAYMAHASLERPLVSP